MNWVVFRARVRAWQCKDTYLMEGNGVVVTLDQEAWDFLHKLPLRVNEIREEEKPVLENLVAAGWVEVSSDRSAHRGLPAPQICTLRRGWGMPRWGVGVIALLSWIWVAAAIWMLWTYHAPRFWEIRDFLGGMAISLLLNICHEMAHALTLWFQTGVFPGMRLRFSPWPPFLTLRTPMSLTHLIEDPRARLAFLAGNMVDLITGVGLLIAMRLTADPLIAVILLAHLFTVVSNALPAPQTDLWWAMKLSGAPERVMRYTRWIPVTFWGGVVLTAIVLFPSIGILMGLIFAGIFFYHFLRHFFRYARTRSG